MVGSKLGASDEVNGVLFNRIFGAGSTGSVESDVDAEASGLGVIVLEDILASRVLEFDTHFSSSHSICG